MADESMTPEKLGYYSKQTRLAKFSNKKSTELAEVALRRDKRMEEMFREMVSKGEITFEEQPKFIRDRIYKLVIIEGVTKTRDGEVPRAEN